MFVVWHVPETITHGRADRQTGKQISTRIDKQTHGSREVKKL